VASKVVEIARRDTGEKIRGVAQNNIAFEIEGLLGAIQKSMFERAKNFRSDNTHEARDYAEFKDILGKGNYFIQCYFDGNSEDEGRIKEETKATVRCIPFAQANTPGKCMYTGRDTARRVIFARSY
jgi:prolyl-tRNA synthetase